MKITQLGTRKDGTRSFEIGVNEIQFHALIRCIRKIPGTIVNDTAHNLMNDEAKATIKYKDIIITIDTPFSDYFLNCQSDSSTFDEFIDKLRNYSVKWWDRFF